MLTKKLALILGMLTSLLLIAGCAANGATQPAATAQTGAPATAAGSLPAPVVERNGGPTPLPSASPSLPSTPAPLLSLTPSATPTPLGPQAINGVALTDIAPLPPETAAHVREIYTKGQALGRDPRAFSKLGDSTLLNPHFLGPFDSGDYALGDFGHLQPTIDRWAGSFARHGVAARHGLHSWTVFDPLWADEEWCLPGEHLLACELRLQNPSVLFIRLGSNDAGAPDGFRYNVKEVIEFCLEAGVIPIIGTKADRFEGSNENNDILRALAAAYHVPLWDFDRAAETLPNRGLDADGVHLIIDELPHDYTQPDAFGRGHAVQDLTAVIVLDQIRRVIEE